MVPGYLRGCSRGPPPTGALTDVTHPDVSHPSTRVERKGSYANQKAWEGGREEPNALSASCSLSALMRFATMRPCTGSNGVHYCYLACVAACATDIRWAVTVASTLTGCAAPQTSAITR